MLGVRRIFLVLLLVVLGGIADTANQMFLK
jgi:hypothetical protein